MWSGEKKRERARERCRDGETAKEKEGGNGEKEGRAKERGDPCPKMELTNQKRTKRWTKLEDIKTLEDAMKGCYEVVFLCWLRLACAESNRYP